MKGANLPPMEWIERVIRIDSVTHRSNEEIVRFLVPLLEDANLKIQEQKVVENGLVFKNLIAFSHSPTADDLLVFNTHLDTVEGGNLEEWTKTGGNPFKATKVGDKLYGLGAADVKLDFLCKILAAKNAKRDRPFALVGTFGEERGLIGAAHLLKSKKVKPKFALVGEPSNLELIYAHKGHFVCTFAVDLGVENVRFMEPPKTRSWKGKAAHSSTPALGKNALITAIDEIRKKKWGLVSLTAGISPNAIPDFCDAQVVSMPTAGTHSLLGVLEALAKLSKEIGKKRDSRFTPATQTLSLTQAVMENGECLVTFDIRLLPDAKPESLQKKVQAILDKNGCRLSYLEIDPPLEGNKNGKFLKAASKALLSCGVKPIVKTKASVTEAALYRLHGSEAIVFGPGVSIGNVHRPNEHNSFKQMEVATRFYQAILESGDF